MSNTPDVLTLAESACTKAVEILSKPAKERVPDSALDYRPLAEMLRQVLDFHYGFENELPRLMTLVENVFGTLQESAPGRWNIKREIDGRSGMFAFQHHVAKLAEYLRGREFAR